jgi:hypothetical protein
MRATSIPILLLFTAVAGAQELDPPCVAAISERFPAWRFAPVSEEVRAYVADISADRADPVLVGGDFDGDGTQDRAALIQTRQEVPKIVFCLGGDKHVKLLAIEQPYCHDCIVLKKKGAKVQEVDTDLIVTLRADGLSAVCYEHASAVYFLDTGRMQEIVDGD